MLLALVLASAVGGRLCYLGRPFDSDAAMFAHMGQLVAAGGRVGPDLIDNKFPTVGLVMTAAWRACGTCWPAYVGVGTALSGIAAAMAGVAARRGGGRATPAVLFTVVYLNFTPAVFGGFQLETALACCGCVAAACGMRVITTGSGPAAFAAGLAGGCGVLLKPTAGGVLVAVAVGLVVGRPRPVRGIAAMAAGTCVPLGVAGIYLSAAHLWGELPAAAGRLSAYAGGSVVDAVTVVKVATVGVLLGWPFAVATTRGSEPKPASEVRRRPGPTGVPPGSSEYLRPGLTGPVAFAVVWLLVELLGVIAQRRMYAYHFLPLAGPAAVLFGLVRPKATVGQLLAGLGPAAALGGCAALAIAARPFDTHLSTGRYLAARSVPGDRVWADDCPRLLIETGLGDGATQPLTFLFANDDRSAAAGSARIVADLTRRRTTFVLLPADLPAWLDRQTRGIAELAAHPARATAYRAGWHRIERFTLAHYRREATVDGTAVYRWRGTDTTSVAGTNAD